MKEIKELIDEIKKEANITGEQTGRSKFSSRTYEALERTPRHLFVNKEQREIAYLDRPLPIGSGQTISQPFIVALMTDLLDLKPTDKVLEIGTGSGYQAAILSKLAAEVYTVEIIESLGEQAEARLAELGISNVNTLVSDGSLGWPQEAPFDGIIVTAAAPSIPKTLIDQLAPGGRMVIPIGDPLQTQYLTLVAKDEDTNINQKEILAVRFVPFTGAAGSS